MRKYLCLVLFLGLALPVVAIAQTNSDHPSVPFNQYLRSGQQNGLGVQLLGLLDPSRMTFSHSYTMSYLSSGGQGVMRGVFMESIGYRISNPLALTVNFGYLHQPYSSFGPDGITQNGSLVGGAALTWRPSKNMFMTLEVGRYPPGYMNNYNSFWTPFPYNSPANAQSNSAAEFNADPTSK